MIEDSRDIVDNEKWAAAVQDIARYVHNFYPGPVFTLVGGYLATILGGTAILESMFSIDGIGQLLYEAVQQRDYPVVVACTIFYAAVYVFVVVIVDLVYAVLDPRIRYGRR